MNKGCKIVSLPTKNFSPYGYIHEGKCFHLYTDGENPNHLQDNLAITHALYAYTDAQATEGWCYSPTDEEVYFINQYNYVTGVARERDGSAFILDGCKKIIASSDTILSCGGVNRLGESCRKNNNCRYPECSLPKISEAFIENFVGNNGQLFDVYVKCDPVTEWRQDKYEDGTYSRSESEHTVGYKVKVTEEGFAFLLCANPFVPHEGAIHRNGDISMIWTGGSWVNLHTSTYTKEDLIAFAKFAKKGKSNLDFDYLYESWLNQ